MKYHGNWKNPKEYMEATAVNTVMDLKEYSNLKGICTKTMSTGGSAINEPAMEYEFSDRAKQYFEDLLECCKEQNV